jgi:hypothetical protein
LRASSSRASAELVVDRDQVAGAAQRERGEQAQHRQDEQAPDSSSRVTTAAQTAVAARTAGHTQRCGSAAAAAADT